MKAVVMAGGEGTRLRPLTSLRPKPMVPIVNQPVMEHILGLVKHHGITEVVVTVAFMPQVIEDYFGDGDVWGAEISYAVEETPLGTAGSVRNAADALTETFLVISGDALTDIDLTAVIEFHRSHDGPVTIALKRVPDPQEFGIVVIDDDGKVTRFLEKPTWAEVVTDTVNTGIYVMDPMVFDYIPEQTPFDFSSDLFPRLMRDGHAIYGCVVDGYWCDVGTLEGYTAVHRDILDGKAMIYIPGSRTRENVWIGEGSNVNPSATVGRNVVIGRNTEVRAGAVLGEYSVVGDNCFIGSDAVVDRSILEADSLVAPGASVRGAIMGLGAEVRRGARVEPGATIGAYTTVGEGAMVGHGVQVYPYKRIEPGAVVTSSLIWESRGVRSVFGPNGVTGLANIDITPGLGLKLAQAFGSVLPNQCHVVVSRDSSRGARMVKRAVAAGLNATGCTVRDLRIASPGVTRFTTRDTRARGGVHVCAGAEDPSTLELHFYDERGTDIAPGLEKKVERLYFRQEFRRAYFSDIGGILYPPRALEYYTAALTTALEAFGSVRRHFRVVADLGMSAATFTLPLVACDWDVELITLRAAVESDRAAEPSADRSERLEQLARAVSLFQADLGVAMDSSAECITLVTESGVVLDDDMALHALVWLWCHGDDANGGQESVVAVPVSASRVIDAIAESSGRRVVRVGSAQKALASAVSGSGVGFAGSRSGGFVFPGFVAAYDAVMSLGMTLRMLDRAAVSLDDVVALLPPVHLRRRSIPCAFDRKGGIMRAMGGLPGVDQTFRGEGVRLTNSDGWALVTPDISEAQVHVDVEGVDAHAADSLLEWSVGAVEQAMADADA